MKRYLIIAVAALASVMPSWAQGDVEAVAPVKPLSYYNPLTPLTLCADPTAVEYEGRVYVYGTNDQQEYDGNTQPTNNTYGKIKSLVVLSSADMVNWTNHGTIDMAAVCGSWMWASWAPSIVSRVEDDGLTHFYMYFSNSGGGVGVVTATHPLGPWTSPLKQSLISGSTPGLGPCTCPFDPGVCIDDNGVGWLVLGGGDPVAGASKLFPGNARIVRLGDDMISLASDIVKIEAPYHFEANEINYIGGKYVYSYCTGWSDRNDWRQYSDTAEAPSTCSICYMVSDDPLNPDSWEWGGEILADPGAFGYPWGNNHTHLHKFGDEYYMFYHTQVMEHLAGISGGYRSLCVNAAVVDEDAVRIEAVTANNAGAPIVKSNRIDPFERQQAETFWNAAGVSVVTEKSETNMSISKVQPGGWVAVRNVNFGDRSATHFTARIRGKGRLEVRMTKPNSSPVAVLEYTGSTMHDVTVPLTKALTGQKTLFFVFTEANSATRFDEWQFDDAEGISDSLIDRQILSTEYFTLDGRRVINPIHGLYVIRRTFSDGSIQSQVITSAP